MKKQIICQTCMKPFSIQVQPDANIAGKVFKFPLPRNCPACCDARDAKFESDKKAAELATLNRRWASICPPLYQDTDPAQLPPAPLRVVMAWTFGRQGLLIEGRSGRGKTRAAFLLVRRLVLEERRNVRVFYGNAFGHQCSTAFGNEYGEQWVNDVVRADVVFFDDFGKVKFTDRIESELFGIIEVRSAHYRPNIITMNMAEAFEDRLTDDKRIPIMRRLTEFCDTVKF